ncbi:hypothetical protein ACH42_10760 [Endozoicomonas sp. (ex Bugula neritina AB1)]|nr:hypothetical protein ACH42_10760 [Endozoicomonas sp. (ex Bugula neritina AB1)]
MALKRIMLLLVLVFLMIGCSKVNQHNYDQLKVGLSIASVEGVLGKPSHCEEQNGTQSCSWEDDNHFIRCSFIANKLVLYSSEGL